MITSSSMQVIGKQPQARRFSTRHETDQVRRELSVVLGDIVELG